MHIACKDTMLQPGENSFTAAQHVHLNKAAEPHVLKALALEAVEMHMCLQTDKSTQDVTLLHRASENTLWQATIDYAQSYADRDCHRKQARN